MLDKLALHFMNELIEAGLTPKEIETVMRRRQVRDLHASGLTAREIAKTLDLTTQSVYQTLAKLELPPNRKATA